jgi:hypothetical protein
MLFSGAVLIKIVLVSQLDNDCFEQVEFHWDLCTGYGVLELDSRIIDMKRSKSGIAAALQ